MAVAKEQIAEIQEIISAYVADIDIPDLIRELRGTVAYRENQSFKETIELLATQEEQEEKDEI